MAAVADVGDAFQDKTRRTNGQMDRQENTNQGKTENFTSLNRILYNDNN